MNVRAAVLSAVDAPLEIADLELDPPRAGEVLVRIAASGVCHSDISTANGTIGTRLPAVLGHEGAGVVEAVGPAVASIAVGDHVVLSWNPSCGACEECLRGLPHLCAAAWDAMFAGGLMDGTPRLHRDGREIYHYSFISSFAERAVVPARSCVRIDPGIPLDIAALVGCAVTTGIGVVWNTAGVRPGERVAVFGCGGVGLSAVLGASAVGAAPIIAVDRRSDKLAVAVSLGATGVVLGMRMPRRRPRPWCAHRAAAWTTPSTQWAGRRSCKPPSSPRGAGAPPWPSASPARTTSSPCRP